MAPQKSVRKVITGPIYATLISLGEFLGNFASDSIIAAFPCRCSKYVPAARGQGAGRHLCTVPPCALAQRPESGSHVGDEFSRLLPGGKVSALRMLPIEEQAGIGTLSPLARDRAWDVVRGNAHHGGNLDALGSEECVLVLPVKPSGGHARIGQPVKRDVV